MYEFTIATVVVNGPLKVMFDYEQIYICSLLIKLPLTAILKKANSLFV